METVRQIRGRAPGIGAYKLYLMLREVYGEAMRGRDWFYRVMHEHGLMLKPPRRRHTTNSNHMFRKYGNLARGMRPTGVNQLWVADITYIDTQEGVVYLHLLTDAFSHEIIGWCVSDTLMAENTVAALRMGIDNVSHLGLQGLMHHSDRGVQYCCAAYTGVLRDIDARISMTEDGSPTDNAIAERVNGIIKQEWLYRMERPRDLVHARQVIGSIIDFYNDCRPHRSNPGMMPPRKLRRRIGEKDFFQISGKDEGTACLCEPCQERKKDTVK